MPRKERRRKEHGGEKIEEKKWTEAQRAKPCAPTLAIDELIGDEEKTGKKEERTKKETGSGSLGPIEEERQENTDK